MPRTLDSLFQATMVMAVIVMSPYAMFAAKGCADGNTQTSGTEDAPRPAAVDAPQPTAAEPAAADPGSATADPGSAALSPSKGSPALEPDAYACVVPRISIPRSAGCEAAEPYPSCRWKVPDPAPGNPFAIWRYTTGSHRWARASLVSLVLATAREYASLYPGERVTLGDLDAPGDRHNTHENGVDADFYLPGRMATENMGKGRRVDNYADRSKSYVEKSRARVLDLARILAACAGGRIRIYYNDPPVIDSVLAWFGKRGLETPFEAPMKPHNDLHLFHFHATIPEDLPVLPFEEPGEP